CRWATSSLVAHRAFCVALRATCRPQASFGGWDVHRRSAPKRSIVGAGPFACGRRRCRMSTTKKDGRVDPANVVMLTGTVSGVPEQRVLPSGDELCVVRVVVPRRGGRPRSDGRRNPSVDVVDCYAWEARPRRTVAGWVAGDEVEVTGA